MVKSNQLFLAIWATAHAKLRRPPSRYVGGPRGEEVGSPS